jgi:tetratricopeptide (TPR) repeat protein/GT2 family glycosyltransferase
MPAATDLIDPFDAAGNVPAVSTRVLRLDPGVWLLRLQPVAAWPGAAGMRLPATHVATVPGAPREGVEILSAPWLDPGGGEVAVRAPPQGGTVMVTRYEAAPPNAAVAIDILPLDCVVPGGQVARAVLANAAIPDGPSPDAGSPQLKIDRPAIAGGSATAPVRGDLQIAGSVAATAGIAAIEAFVDDALAAVVDRPKLADRAAAADGASALVAGEFETRISHRRLPPGRHRLRIAVRDGLGRATAVEFAVEAEGPATTEGWLQVPRRKIARAEIDLQMRVLAGLAWRPRFVLLLLAPGDAAGIRQARRTLASLRIQAYPHWRAAVLAAGPARPRRLLGLLDGFADIADNVVVLPPEDECALSDPAVLGDAPAPALFGVLRAGDELGCDALLELALLAGLEPSTDFAYADDRRLDPATGTAKPWHKPQWSPDLLLSTNYIGRAWVASAELLRRSRATLGELGRFGIYDLVLRLTEAATKIRHAPRLLYEQGPLGEPPRIEQRALRRALTRRGIAGTVLPGGAPGIYQVRRARRSRPLVSIIIPTCGRAGLIKTCIGSLRAKTAYRHYEILVIDNIPAGQPGCKRWLHDNVDTVIDMPEPFNWARFNNAAAARAKGEYLLFLNDDTEITEPGWLDALLEHAQRPEVGVVGPLLLHADGTVQHAGMFLSPARLWGEHAFLHADGDATGPFGTMLTTRNVIAVTGACMLMRRHEFERFGGFDERHAVLNNDLDYCLRSWRGGRLTVFTPYARLIHHGRASIAGRSQDYDAAGFARRWRDLFLLGDPYYSPCLSHERLDYSADAEPTCLVYPGPLFAAAEIRRILVVKLDFIGDFTLAIPALRRLKQHFSQARLTLLAARETARLAALAPAIDEVLELDFFDPDERLRQRPLSPADIGRIEETLASRRFDLAIDLRTAPETRQVLLHSGARWLAGFDHRNRFPWLDVALEWDGFEPLVAKRHHLATDLLRLVEAVIHSGEPGTAAIAPRPLRAASAEPPPIPEELFSRPVVCVHPGAGTDAKQWPPSCFAELIDLLSGGHAVNIALIGGADDVAVAEAVLAAVRDRRSVFSLAGRLRLEDLPELIARCALFVGNDSGPQHIAAGLGVPTVGIHSGTVDARQWAPLGPAAVAIQRRMACSPCYLLKAADCQRGLACLRQLGAGEVYRLCTRMLAIGGVDHVRRASREGQAPAIAGRGDVADGHNDRGAALMQAGRLDEAAVSYRAAIAVRPDHAVAQFNLGCVLRLQGDLDAAIACFRHAIADQPEFFDAQRGLAVTAHQRGHLGEALAFYRRALDQRPDHAETLCEFGLLLLRLERTDDAIACLERAIRAAPGLAWAHNHLGTALSAQNRIAEAIASYDRALALKPDFADAQWNRGLARLVVGEFAGGWADYEQRWRLEFVKARQFAQPWWEGEDIAGKTILVHAEQGIGDTIQFLRYVPLLAARGARVVVEVPPTLLRLAASCRGATEVIATGAPLPDFDVHSPLLSLPLRFGTTLATIPADVPYLAPDPVTVDRWRSALGGAAGLKVGLVWAGAAGHKCDYLRSLVLETLAPLWQVPGIRWYSLQVGRHAGDTALLPSGVATDLSSQLSDFAETAGVIANLDLVLAVDTAVLHLAGALGRPAWAMLAFAPDWRWLLDRDDSPWYPSLRLFRQPALGDWGGLIAAVLRALAELAGQKVPEPVLPPPVMPRLSVLDPQAAYETVLRHRAAGRSAQAEAAAREIAQHFPSHAGAHHILGVAAHERGHHSEAIALLRRAAALDPTQGAMHANLGTLLGQAGHHAEAAESFRRAVALQPGNADWHYDLGVALAQAGHPQEAAASYRAAIAVKPEHVSARCNLAALLLQQGDLDAAIAEYRQVLAADPRSFEAQRMLAASLHQRGLTDEALTAYRRAIDLQPGHADTLCDFGLLLLQRERYDEALLRFQQAIAIAPGLAAAHGHLGVVLHKQGRFAEAADSLRRAIGLKPDDAGPHVSMGGLLADQGLQDEAAECFRRAIALDPSLADAYCNLGNMLLIQTRPREAIEIYRQCLRLNADHAGGHFGLGLAHLTLGEFDGGWRGYEWRWRAVPSFGELPQPLWTGEEIAGKTMLLRREQGIGDTIQMLRYVPLLAARGARVVAEVPAELVRLAATVAGMTEVRAAGGELPLAELNCTFMSLPERFGTRLDTIPAEVPYLVADPVAVAQWRRELGDAPGLKIGLVWAGNRDHPNDTRRSLPFSRLLPLFGLPRIRWFSLQVGERASDLQTLPDGLVRDLSPDLEDLAETAAVIANLDLVLAVDTAVAHLTGAVARPAWVMLPFWPDWRWLLDRDDSPWYPTMRLFRQPALDDWEGVIAAVQQALAEAAGIAEPEAALERA